MPDLPTVAAVDCHHAAVAAVTETGQQSVHGLQLDNSDNPAQLQLNTSDNVAGLQLETSDNTAGLQLDNSDHNAAGGLQLDEWSAVHAVDTQCYAAVTPAAAEHEDRVMEALGISNKVRNRSSFIVLAFKKINFYFSPEKMWLPTLCTMKTSHQTEQDSTNNKVIISPCGLMT